MLWKVFVILILISGVYGEECVDGISCIGCSDFRRCINGVVVGEVITCKGNNCPDEVNQCRLRFNCFSSVVTECIEIGVFPDPTNSSSFFVCIGDPFTGFIKHTFSCPVGEVFDQVTVSCVAQNETTTVLTSTTASSSTALTSTTTSTPTAAPTTTPNECTASGIFPDTTAETNFYVCLGDAATGFTKYDFSCPEAHYFDFNSIMCIPQAATASTVVSTVASTTQLTTVAPTITTASPTPTPGLCTVPGIFVAPANCKMYIRCSTSLQPFYFICPGASYFNEYLLKCSIVISPTCQEQILKNSTTSTALTAPITTVTTTTTTVATSGATATPFKCSAAGTFENPISCKTYYRCSTSGKVVEFTCPGSSYYNEFTKLCTMELTPRCQNLLATYG